MVKRSLRESYIYAGEVYGPGAVELPEEADKALRAKGAFGDEPTAIEALVEDARADAVDTDPAVQAAAEKAAQSGRQEALSAAAEQAQTNANALKAATKGGK